MGDNIKIASKLSRRAKINILIIIFLIFIAAAALTSINQIKYVIEKREKLVELREKLNWYRNENIGLLALEKSLYEEETIELEARKQFNMTSGDEINVSIISEDDASEQANKNNSSSASKENTYSGYDLWENIKAFYNSEIRDDD
jgi:cell division protein FtsL